MGRGLLYKIRTGFVKLIFGLASMSILEKLQFIIFSFVPLYDHKIRPKFSQIIVVTSGKKPIFNNFYFPSL